MEYYFRSNIERLLQYSQKRRPHIFYTDIEGEHLFIDTNTDRVLEVIKKYITEQK